jgi:hypothetical protein
MDVTKVCEHKTHEPTLKMSFFFCGDTVHFGSPSKESLQLHLKSEEAGMSSAEINKLVKQSSHSPWDFHKTASLPL